jgi:hypothetical protein
MGSVIKMYLFIPFIENSIITVQYNPKEATRRYSVGPRINPGLVEFLKKSFSR